MSKNTKNAQSTNNAVTTTTSEKHSNARITLHVAKRYQSLHERVCNLASKWDVEESNLIWYILGNNVTLDQAEAQSKPADLPSKSFRMEKRLADKLGKLSAAQLQNLKSYLEQQPHLKTTEMPQTSATVSVA